MNTIKLIIAWTWVALPLGWGVYQSVQKSLPLFQEQSKPDETDVDTSESSSLISPPSTLDSPSSP